MSLKRTLGLLLAGALATMTLVTPASALDPVSDKHYDGIDLSVYQGEVDFELLRQSGIEAIYIRAGYGDDGVDHYFQRNAAIAEGGRISFWILSVCDCENGGRSTGRSRLLCRLDSRKEI